MIRKIIRIDKDKCNGCGACASACHEGAIDIINGKAELVREHFCDGLGDCLPECPTGAISFEEREAPEYDEKAVQEAQKKTLQNWPVQIKLAPANAPYFNDAKLLIAADCTAYAYASFHQDFIRNKVTLIGCPKLDQVDYSDKLTEIIQNNNIQSVTIVRMEVPCCGGLEFAEAISRIQGYTLADQENWDNLFAKLSSLKPNIGVYASQHSDIESMLSNGDIVMSVETNGRAIGLMKEGYDIGFCQPEEGSIAMTSLAAISKGSTKKELAYLFVNELISPEGQKAYAENNYYAPSNGKTVIAEELREYMPYGQEQVSKLLYMDSETLEPVKAALIERWNKEFK